MDLLLDDLIYFASNFDKLCAYNNMSFIIIRKKSDIFIHVTFH